MHKIQLGHTDSYAIIDDCDLNIATEYDWHLSPNGYAIRRERYGPGGTKKKVIYLHKEIFGPVPDGSEIDHANGNKLDDRRSNMRIATRSQNCGNQRLRRGCSSRFKGVAWVKNYKRWWAYINKDGRRHNLGYYDDEVEAAKAYNKAALELFGPFARLNPV
jgi:hypothetical protein